MKRQRRGNPYLASVRRDIAQWRHSRQKLGPMPEPLWSDAVTLADRHGVGPVATELKLGYATLKRRLQARRQSAGRSRGPNEQPRSLAPASTTPTASFVQVGLLNQVPTPSGATVVEVSSQNGTKLRVQLAAGSQLDWRSLAAAFWGES